MNTFPDYDLPRIKAVSAGGGFTLMLDESGVVWSIGKNSSGQLGIGSRAVRKPLDQPDKAGKKKIEGKEPLDQPDKAGKMKLKGKVKAISAGMSHSLLLLENGEAWAVGHNGQGQCTQSENKSEHTHTPRQIRGMANAKEQKEPKVKDVSAGRYFSLILLENGDVWAVGDNTGGNLGIEGKEESNCVLKPGKINIDGKVKAISAGHLHSLLLLESGEVFAVGCNYYGQLGIETTGEFYRFPVKMKMHPDAKVKAVSAGEHHSLMLEENGDVWVVGSRGANASDRDTHTPVKIDMNAKVAAISGCSAISLMLLENGEVWGMGYNINKQLGIGKWTQTSSQITPAKMQINPYKKKSPSYFCW